MNVDFNKDYFALFGLSRTFRLDAAVVEQVYRDLQSRVHPDRFAHLPETERRLSMQWATQVNEAYRTLRHPLSRAQYLLQLQGQDTGETSNTAMSPQFLMEQMEWREAVAEAQAAEDSAALEQLHHRLRQHAREIHGEIERAIDAEHNYAAAADAVRRLMFVEKLQHDIDHALETMEP